ncbi:unnamed protein product [Linum tenue]|uniref:Uncharacterized protein n=1 Tax=Linum tenue TaxID=586396 RepID=A0AAV0RY86_9ROSI|nr:unnamed protein product [Linum tenue]
MWRHNGSSSSGSRRNQMCTARGWCSWRWSAGGGTFARGRGRGRR